MQPIQRFKSSISDSNLWIYILSLAKGEEVQNREVVRLIFEKFGFLPNDMLVRTVLFRLKRDGYASAEKFKGEGAYKTTEKGLKELEAMKAACQNLLQKI